MLKAKRSYKSKKNFIVDSILVTGANVFSIKKKKISKLLFTRIMKIVIF